MGRPIPPTGGEYRDDPAPVALPPAPDSPYTDDSIPPPAYDEATGSAPIQDEAGDNTNVINANPNDAEEAGMPLFLPTGTTPQDVHFSSTTRYPGAKRSHIPCEVNSFQDTRSDADPNFLKKWIEYMAAQPPSPYIHVIGRHNETRRDKDDKTSTEEITDFRILINMQNYLWPNDNAHGLNIPRLTTVENEEKTYRGTALKKIAPNTRAGMQVGDAKPGLNEWCHRYCASHSRTKMFRLTRTVTGMDEDLLRSRLEDLIRGTNYKGRLSIEFPIADRAVDIFSTGSLNNWRNKTWIRWVFYLTFLWIFSWPFLFFVTKKYHVVRAEWPFSQTDAQGRKKYTTISEEEWLEKFGPAVRRLCLDRYEGMSGENHLTHVLERWDIGQSSLTEITNSPGLLNLAAGALQGGPNALSQVNNLMRFASGSGDQAGWGFDTDEVSE